MVLEEYRRTAEETQVSNPRGTRKYPTFLDRLLAHSVILPWSGCYIHLGSITESGYVKVTVKKDGKPRSVYVHRAAYEAFYGVQLPTGREHPLRHTCHIPCCWRPDHLIPGTQQQNVADAVARGTQTNGWRLYHESKRQAQHLRSIMNATEKKDGQ